LPVVEIAIVSAAGIGSRLGMNMPKCLVRVAGRRIIEWQLDLLRDVPEVRVVVGFLEDEVIECVRTIRPDVIFVRNPRYTETTTLQSIALASRNLKEPFLILDGDLLIEPGSFAAFLATCRPGEPTIGIAPAHSDDAVFVSTRAHQDAPWVTGFQRSPRTDMEWTGLAWLDSSFIADRHCHVYQMIEPRLPLRAAVVHALEVDTSGDLARANRLVSDGQWRQPPVSALTTGPSQAGQCSPRAHRRDNEPGNEPGGVPLLSGVLRQDERPRTVGRGE
jgi:choline kinase